MITIEHILTKYFTNIALRFYQIFMFKLCSHQAAALQVRDRIEYRNELSVSHQEISCHFDSRLFTCPRKSMWYCFAPDKARA